jgi:hypothetical protein
MKKLTPMPSKTPLVDANGMITVPWQKYFQAFLEAITELQEAVEELQGGP